MKLIASLIILLNASFSFGQQHYTGTATELDYYLYTAVQGISLEMYDNNDTTYFVSASQNIGSDFRLIQFYIQDSNGNATDLTSVRGGGYTSQGNYYKKDNANYFVKVLFHYLAVDQLSEGQVVHYPNPFSDKLTIELGDEKQAILVTTMNGEELISLSANGKCELDLSHLASGFYLLRVGNSVTRVVKQ